MRFLSSWFKRRILGDQTERWNHQYNSGRWEKLKWPIEHARFELCADLIREFAPRGDILEIGSGEALLMQHLKPDEYASWLGVDLSDVAIQRAQAFANERVRYVAADMTTFAMDRSFDAIVFPESIYYVTERAALLRRYAVHLKSNGVFIISIFDGKRSGAVWDEIHTVTTVIEKRATTNEHGTWTCEVLRMR